MKRYNHWFWNSWLVNRFASFAVWLNTYLWSKQYGKN